MRTGRSSGRWAELLDRPARDADNGAHEFRSAGDISTHVRRTHDVVGTSGVLIQPSFQPTCVPRRTHDTRTTTRPAAATCFNPRASREGRTTLTSSANALSFDRFQPTCVPRRTHDANRPAACTNAPSFNPRASREGRTTFGPVRPNPPPNGFTPRASRDGRTTPARVRAR